MRSRVARTLVCFVLTLLASTTLVRCGSNSGRAASARLNATKF